MLGLGAVGMHDRAQPDSGDLVALRRRADLAAQVDQPVGLGDHMPPCPGCRVRRVAGGQRPDVAVHLLVDGGRDVHRWRDIPASDEVVIGHGHLARRRVRQATVRVGRDHEIGPAGRAAQSQRALGGRAGHPVDGQDRVAQSVHEHLHPLARGHDADVVPLLVRQRRLGLVLRIEIPQEGAVHHGRVLDAIVRCRTVRLRPQDKRLAHVVVTAEDDRGDALAEHHVDVDRAVPEDQAVQDGGPLAFHQSEGKAFDLLELDVAFRHPVRRGQRHVERRGCGGVSANGRESDRQRQGCAT